MRPFGESRRLFTLIYGFVASAAKILRFSGKVIVFSALLTTLLTTVCHNKLPESMEIRFFYMEISSMLPDSGTAASNALFRSSENRLADFFAPDNPVV